MAGYKALLLNRPINKSMILLVKSPDYQRGNLAKENIMGKSQDKGKDKGSKKKPKASKKK